MIDAPSPLTVQKRARTFSVDPGAGPCRAAHTVSRGFELSMLAAPFDLPFISLSPLLSNVINTSLIKSPSARRALTTPVSLRVPIKAGFGQRGGMRPCHWEPQNHSGFPTLCPIPRISLPGPSAESEHTVFHFFPAPSHRFFRGLRTYVMAAWGLAKYPPHP